MNSGEHCHVHALGQLNRGPEKSGGGRARSWAVVPPSAALLSADLSAPLEMGLVLITLNFFSKTEVIWLTEEQSLFKRKLASLERGRQMVTALEKPTSCPCACSRMYVPAVTDGNPSPWTGAWVLFTPELGGSPSRERVTLTLGQ